jgi:hypothetical protein
MSNRLIVVLLATQGSLAFLENALISLSRVGVDPRTFHVARPDHADDINHIWVRRRAQASERERAPWSVYGGMGSRQSGKVSTRFESQMRFNRATKM